VLSSSRRLSPDEQDYVHHNPQHHDFHFTDVPIQQAEYRLGAAGTRENDVVQIIKPKEDWHGHKSSGSSFVAVTPRRTYSLTLFGSNVRIHVAKKMTGDMVMAAIENCESPWRRLPEG
jgi:hypothetical protein